MNTKNECTACGNPKMKPWSELTEEEREVVKRLPGAADYNAGERQAMHLWCTRCWNEETSKPRHS